MNRRMLPMLVFALIGAPALFACLWDYDTLASEAAGKPDAIRTIVGAFPRNPDLYYEVRLERVTKLLAENPGDLDALDAAAVCCDKLHRQDEAIAWMARKHEQLLLAGDAAKNAKQPNHWYRYYANLGTFYAHRWFFGGRNREDVSDLEKARDLVATAIKENPDAHFGREKYQLMFIEWFLLDEDFDEEKWRREPNMFGIGYWGDDPRWKHDPKLHHHQTDSTNDSLEKAGFGDAIEGVSGLVTLGAAWKARDAFYLLYLLNMVKGDHAVAQLAGYRAQELEDGPPDTWPPADPGEAYHGKYASLSKESYRKEYTEMRKAADAWHKARTDFMLAKLKKGEHPDTHKDFWEGFDDPHGNEVVSLSWNPLDEISGRMGIAPNQPVGKLAVILIVLCGLGLLIMPPILLVRRSRRLKRAQQQTLNDLERFKQ